MNHDAELASHHLQQAKVDDCIILGAHEPVAGRHRLPHNLRGDQDQRRLTKRLPIPPMPVQESHSKIERIDTRLIEQGSAAKAKFLQSPASLFLWKFRPERHNSARFDESICGNLRCLCPATIRHSRIEREEPTAISGIQERIAKRQVQEPSFPLLNS